MTTTQEKTLTEVVTCEDGLKRSPWAANNPLLEEYYDTEWGVPLYEEQDLFELLCLEGFQAGLSWATVLRKRDAFRRAFADFDPEVVATFDEAKVEQLLNDASIIRNRRKIESAINNAKATLELRAEGGLSEFIWSFTPPETPCPVYAEDVPQTSPESCAMSKALRKAGFSFVGPVTCFAMMEALGMVDTHLVGSHRRGRTGIWAPSSRDGQLARQSSES